MLGERLIPHGFLTQLHYPPQTYGERSLKELYLSLSEGYRYPQFNLLPNGQGAVMKEGEKRTVEIYPDRLVIKEQPAQATFEEYLSQVVPIVREARARLGHPVWLIQQGIMRFLIQFDSPVAPILRNNLFNLSEEALQQFRRPMLGLCLRLEFPPTKESHVQSQLRVEPYFRDPSRLYLEVSERHLQPTNDPDVVGERLRSTEAFLKENCLAFLEEALSNKLT